jgi:hypothetical protein
MHEENTNQHEKKTASVIEDLTLEETEAGNVKGGAVDFLLQRFTMDGVPGEAGDHKHK